MNKKTHIPVLHSHLFKGVSHGFFTRQGGVSTGDYASLNGSLKNDTPENVQKNRLLALQALSLETVPLCLLKQVHGKDVHCVDASWDFNQQKEGDALVTKRLDVAIGIQTADCVPVMLFDRHQGIVAAIHAGWRGAAQGVVEETVRAMKALGSNPSEIVGAIGPCIAQESYEVGEEVYDAVLKANRENEQFFFRQNTTKRFYFDLPGLVLSILETLGVTVERLPYDTYAEDDLFFSCRRAYHENAKSFGGHLSIISLATGKTA